MEERGVRACSKVAAVKVCARWEQLLKVDMRTGLWKGSETRLGLGGWSEVRSHPRTGQDRKAEGKEQSLNVRRRSEGGNNRGLFGGIGAGK